LTELGSLDAPSTVQYAGSLQEPEGSGLTEPPESLAEPPGASQTEPSAGVSEPPGTVAEPPGVTPANSEQSAVAPSSETGADAPTVQPTFWMVFSAGLVLMIAFYGWFIFVRL